MNNIGRLLWVDDEIDLLKGHIVFLEKKGYAVQTCSNGPDAIDLCRENNYDLILLDENMPGLSGLETLAAIKEITPNVPIVMVTKNEAEDLMDQAIGSKIADYLLKPVNPKQILLTLKKNIHRTEIQQEVVQTNYRQEFARISMQIGDDLNAEQWKELYKKLVHWELEIGRGRRVDARDAGHAENGGQPCLCQVHQKELRKLDCQSRRTPAHQSGFV